MGGNIDVDSTYGEGATFRFYVKMRTSNTRVEPTPTTTPPPPPLPAVVSHQSPAAQTAYHILITEDNIINQVSKHSPSVAIKIIISALQTVLNRQLKQFGFTTELASNGKEALDRILRLSAGNKGDAEVTLPQRFDVILVSEWYWH